MAVSKIKARVFSAPYGPYITDDSSYTGNYSPTTNSFADIPTKSGMYCVYGLNQAIPDSPFGETTSNHWWNVLQLGTGTRMLQIAVNAFNTRDTVYFRVKHDSTWYGWYKLQGTHV